MGTFSNANEMGNIIAHYTTKWAISQIGRNIYTVSGEKETTSYLDITFTHLNTVS